MKTPNNIKFETYKAEAQERWGGTDAYREHAEKSKDYSKDRWDAIAAKMDEIFAEFAVCMKNGAQPNSAEAQTLVKKLQNHITEHYYACTDGILAGLGQMYAADERFMTYIDRHAGGTAEFVSKAIESCCAK